MICKTIKWLFALAIIVTASDIMGQQLDLSKFENMKPRSIGPAGMSGRVTAIDVEVNEPDVIYAGTASGGLWKSTSGGIDWDPIFDNEKVASIGAIAIQQSNPDVVWVGTGEGNPRNSVTGGGGLYKSLDGGKSWILMGLEKTRNIYRIIVDPTDPNTVYVGAIGSSWGEHPERGLFKTTDGGKSWNKILYANPRTGVGDMVMDPTNPQKLIVGLWEHQRKPWTFTSGGPGSGMYLTLDGGANWKKISDEDGLPKGELGRIGLAIAPSEPSIVYAMVESNKNALYKSTDGGYKWRKINDEGNVGNRPFYYSDIFVDPKNENRIYHLFSMVDRSEDGGKSFQTILPYSGIHPDHHAWWIHPEDPDYMIDGNDGGLNITRDRGETWQFVENIPVAQYYHISVDMDYPYNVYGGMQDNGSWAGPAYVLRGQGIRNSYWQEVMFGDGFDVVPDPDDSRFGYAMSQQGNVGRYDRETGRVNTIKPTHPDPEMRLRFNWNSAIAQDPFDNSTIYFGSQFVHKSTDKGKTWEIISEDLTTNDPEKQKQGESGGLTLDATGAENYTTVIAIEPSSLKKDLIWVGTDDGKVHITQNGGANWAEVTQNIGMPAGAWVPQIRASKHNPGEAFVIVNNYRKFDFKPYLFRTQDYGKTWVNLVNEAKVDGYTHALAQDPIEKRLLFLGTEFGLYVSIDEGVNWTKWTNGYPTVSTIDLVIHPREHDLVIGTFGRAAWILDDIRPLREVAAKGAGTLSKKVYVYEPPVAVLAQSIQPEGSRFPGDGMYQGENRRFGAMITYSISKSDDKPAVAEETAGRKSRRGRNNQNTTPEPKAGNKSTGPKADSLKIEFLNASGDVIRKVGMRAPKEDGLHRYYWYMNEDGAKRPRRSSRGNRWGGGGGGATVLPGEYTVRISFAGETSETKIKVISDPRIQFENGELEAKYQAQKELEKFSESLAEATTRINESLKIIGEYDKLLKEKKGDEFKDLKEMSKDVKKELNSLMDFIMGEVSKKQGIYRSPDPSITTHLFTAMRYVSSVEGLPGPTEERLMKVAEDKTNEAIDKVNEFYGSKWTEYRKAIQEADLHPFKDYEDIEKK